MNVFKIEFDAPKIDTYAIFRYMGAKDAPDVIKALVEECLNECMPAMKYSVCYTITDLILQRDNISLQGFGFSSDSLTKLLKGYNKALVFASTVGVGIDRLVVKYSRLSPSRAHCLQAIGAERIESLCDLFCHHMAAEYSKISKRFSPGYGDLNIGVQREILNVLDAPRLIGLTLNGSLIMSPTKSVTAIAGLI